MYNHTLVNNSKLGDTPWYTSTGLLCFCDILLLGWLQRMALITSTPECYYHLEKYVIE